MKRTMDIMWREYRAYFDSPIAYIVLTVLLFFQAFFFFNTLFVIGTASMRNFFSAAPFAFVIVGPALTMRLFAEERKSGTLEHLLTLPLSETQAVLGKFLAAVGVIKVYLLFTLPFAFSVAWATAPNAQFDWGPVVGGYLGLIFLGATFASIGLFASSLSRNQIVAFIVGIALCFSLWFIDKVAILLPQNLAAFFEYISVDYHFNNIARGVVDSRDVIFYLSVIFAFLLLTVRVIQTKRA